MSLRIDAPAENFARGLTTVDFPELGEKKQGKVRDIWDLDTHMLLVTTDRTSAFDRVICNVPDKGQVLNETSRWWQFLLSNGGVGLKDQIPTHIVHSPHPNVSFVAKAVDTLPVEMVVREYMAESSTSTSVFRNYQNGLREIYGQKFPDGLVANQKFPDEVGKNGMVITPTTKAEMGEHDQMLALEEARDLVNNQFGK